MYHALKNQERKMFQKEWSVESNTGEECEYELTSSWPSQLGA